MVANFFERHFSRASDIQLNEITSRDSSKICAVNKKNPTEIFVFRAFYFLALRCSRNPFSVFLSLSIWRR